MPAASFLRLSTPEINFETWLLFNQATQQEFWRRRIKRKLQLTPSLKINESTIERLTWSRNKKTYKMRKENCERNAASRSYRPILHRTCNFDPEIAHADFEFIQLCESVPSRFYAMRIWGMLDYWNVLLPILDRSLTLTKVSYQNCSLGFISFSCLFLVIYF